MTLLIGRLLTTVRLRIQPCRRLSPSLLRSHYQICSSRVVDVLHRWWFVEAYSHPGSDDAASNINEHVSLSEQCNDRLNGSSLKLHDFMKSIVIFESILQCQQFATIDAHNRFWIKERLPSFESRSPLPVSVLCHYCHHPAASEHQVFSGYLG